jgi:hypothetical protein
MPVFSKYLKFATFSNIFVMILICETGTYRPAKFLLRLLVDQRFRTMSDRVSVFFSHGNYVFKGGT